MTDLAGEHARLVAEARNKDLWPELLDTQDLLHRLADALEGTQSPQASDETFATENDNASLGETGLAGSHQTLREESERIGLLSFVALIVSVIVLIISLADFVRVQSLLHEKPCSEDDWIVTVVDYGVTDEDDIMLSAEDVTVCPKPAQETLTSDGVDVR